jgi:hypothetical protein
MYGIHDAQREIKDIFLEPNHTHFIIVYNAENGEDVHFRFELEEELRKRFTTMSFNDSDSSRFTKSNKTSRASSQSNYQNVCSANEDVKSIASVNGTSNHEDIKNSIPMIHLYVHGGLEMLNTCKKALSYKIPILLFQVKIDFNFILY